ncbi:MAG: hypothetical protein AAGE96_13855 [Cyanobacteria bacterium P01_G01_bin.19]
MSVGCSNFPVKVPKGFNYDAVERALEQKQSVSLADEACYVALQLCIQDYRQMFEANFIDGRDGAYTIDYEYQTFPFYLKSDVESPCLFKQGMKTSEPFRLDSFSYPEI